MPKSTVIGLSFLKRQNNNDDDMTLLILVVLSSFSVLLWTTHHRHGLLSYLLDSNSHRVSSRKSKVLLPVPFRLRCFNPLASNGPLRDTVNDALFSVKRTNTSTDR